MVFKKVIKPLVSPYERPLDAIGFVINEILNVIIGASLLLPKWAVKQWSREPIDEVNSHSFPLRQTSSDLFFLLGAEYHEIT